MTRSVWKGPFVDVGLLRRVIKLKRSGKSHQMLKTMSRASAIVPDFIGVTFLVHNGKKYIPVTAVDQMVGHKLGEFAPTRVFHGHGGDKKGKKD